ncbi:unnamed protein product [Owenia fusiformis]|uniref:Uncharacterized protein n=1 Tax=Owenia fusiformis TaxID=6347 RepID=A0A8J1UTY0_OWEFU|nr:unnamed protein product [Owenia fusiformis]
MAGKLFICILCTTMVKLMLCENVLFTSNGTNILYKKLSTTDEFAIADVGETERVVGLVIDSINGKIFWSDVGVNSNGIYSADITETGIIKSSKQKIINFAFEVNGIAIDGLSRHIYWTDVQTGSVNVANYDGSSHRMLIRKNLVKPRSIWVNSEEGWLYWDDQGTGKVERSRLDGSGRSDIMSTGLRWPNEITQKDGNVYWVEAWNKTLEYWDGDIVETLPLEEHTGIGNPIFGLASIENHDFLYASVWNVGKILQIDVTNRKIETITEGLGSEAMFGVAIYVAGSSAYSASDPCANNPCSDLCLPVGTSYRCSCPSFGGKVLTGNTCSVPEQIVLYASADDGEVGVMSSGQGANQERSTIALSVRPVAVGYDPVDQMVYWSDVTLRAIYRASLTGNGLDMEVFLNTSHSLGVVDGLYMDYMNRRLYFSNMGTVGVDDVAYSWHKVEMISLDGTNRREIVTDSQNPRDVTVDFEGGYLYYTTWGSDAKVVRTSLDGQDTTVLKTGLDNPNAVVMARDDIYVIDSHAKTREGGQTGINGALYKMNKNGENWVKVLDDLQTPFGLASSGDKFYISDWGKEQILSYSIDGATTTNVILDDIATPTALHSSQKMVTLPGESGVCSTASNTCQEICTTEPGGSEVSCSCSSYDYLHLKAGTQCSAPTSFIVFADFNSIKIIGLDSDNPESHVLVEGNSYVSNFVAVAFDGNSKVYYADVNTYEIFYTTLDGSTKHQLVFKSEDSIDGMALYGGRLYYTSFNRGLIATIKLDGEDKDNIELISLLDRPRAIEVKVIESKPYLFWSEWGNNTAVQKMQLSLDGRAPESSENLQISPQLTWPNGLAVTERRLYIADGNPMLRKIQNCSLTGHNCNDLGYFTNKSEHLYDIEMVSMSSGNGNDYMIYTDWKDKSLSMYNLQTGDITVLADNLMRPTQVAVHITTPTTTECPSNHGCEVACVVDPTGYHCSCGLGKTLNADGKTCKTVYAKVEKVDMSACSSPCGEYEVCGRTVGSANLECVCDKGQGHASNAGCYACAVGLYKDFVGNQPCKPCPEGTGGEDVGATSCSCTSEYTWYEGACRVDACLVEGTAYALGETYSPNSCTTCECKDTGPQCTSQTCQELLCEEKVVPARECCPVCISTTPAPVTTPAIGAFTNCNEDEQSLQLEKGRDTIKSSYMLEYQPQNATLSYEPISYPYVRFTGQQIDVTGTLKWNDKVEQCTFKVDVEDKERPTVQCEDVSVFLGEAGKAASVYWMPPKVTDNVAESTELQEDLVCSPYSSGDPLKEGAYVVNCKVQDSAKNEGTCSFSVSVQKNVGKCPTPPNITGGKFSCKGTECSVTCNEGRQFSGSFPPVYSCKTDTWSPKFPKNLAAFACKKLRSKPIMIQSTIKLDYSGECSTATKERLIDESRTLLRNHGACMHSGNSFCQDGAFTAKCENSVKREAPGTAVMWDVVIVDSMDGTVKADDINIDLDEVIEDIQVKTVTYTVDGGEVTLLDISKETESRKAACPPGEIVSNQNCEICPAGSKQEDADCVVCPIGEYQGYEGSTSCDKCPEGTTTDLTGSFTLQQCRPIVKNPEKTMMKDTPVGLIVGVVVAVIVLIIVIVVVVCLMNRRNRKPAGYLQADDGGELRAYNSPITREFNNPAYDLVGEKADDNGYASLDKPSEHQYATLCEARSGEVNDPSPSDALTTFKPKVTTTIDNNYC